MTKTIIMFVVLAIVVSATMTSFAYAAPQPNGQPFLQLQQQIDAINQQLSSIGGAFVTLIQFNQEVSDRQAADTTLQTNIDAEAAARQAADSQLQQRVTGFCVPGSSIREINADGTVVCEADDVGLGGGSAGTLVVREVRDLTPASGSPIMDSFAACDTGNGEIPIGGGYELTNAAANVFREERAFTSEGFGWLVSAISPSGSSDLTAIVYCAKIVP